MSSSEDGLKDKVMKYQGNMMQRIAPYSADVLDPFVLQRTIPLYQKVKVFLLTFTLLPLRILFMLAFLIFAWVIGVTTIKGLPEEERTRQKPISGWRKKWAKPFIVSIARFIFVIGGWHWIPAKGKRASAKEAPILLLIPHTSFWDTVPVIALGCPCLVVRDDTENVPFFGDLVNYTQPVYVKRNDPMSRQKAIDEILRRCHSGDDWEQFLIFPEGTCANRRVLLEFKLGAFYPGVPVQPVFIRYPNRLDTTTWTWNGPGALEQIWLTLSQIHTFCELEFLPVYNPTTDEKENPRLFADNLRRFISRTCDIPISYFSLDDVKYLETAKSQKLPRTAPIVKILKLRKKTGKNKLDFMTELSSLKKRQESLGDPIGDVQHFAEYIDTEVSEVTKELFYLMDQEKVGKIDVRVYDVALWLLRTNMNEWKRLEYCFKVFDANGIITLNQFALIALIWRGLPINVSLDLFHILNFESKQKGTISFETFKSIAKSYIEIEKKSPKEKKKKKVPWWCFKWKLQQQPADENSLSNKLK